jgi:branched-chain amino acid transport system ATP-binding protein
MIVPPRGQERMLELEEVTSFYGKVEVVSRVSLGVAAGEAVALLGRNGAGKTALMRTIMGLVPPRLAGGRVRFHGRDITGRPAFEIARRGIGYAPDDRKIFPHLSVAENLELARRLTPRGRTPAAVDAMLDRFPLLAGLKDRSGSGLSGGEQKMLAIARAMIQEPPLLLLDETSEGLSPVMVAELVAALGRLREQGVTMVIADQNLRFATKVADRGHLLERGRIVLSGSVEELWHQLSTDQLRLMA